MEADVNDSAELRAMSAPWSDTIELLLRIRTASGQLSCGTNVEMETVEPGHQVNPTFRLRTEKAQQLMDDLWSCGLRPSEGTGSAGAMRATEKHLDDMRRLVFHRLDETTQPVSDSDDGRAK